MNFKWKSVLCAFILGSGMAFTSCSDNDNEGILPGGEEPVGEEGYVSLQLSSATKLLTKAAITEVGAARETSVKEGLLVFYDPVSMKVEYRFPLSISNGTGSTNFSGSDVSGATVANQTTKVAFTTTAKKVAKKDYLLLVVLNPTDKMKSATNSIPANFYMDFEEAKQEVISNFGSPDGDGVFGDIPMTNASGLIKVSESQLKASPVLAEEASDLPKVKVDRILSKVVFYEKAGGVSVFPTGATLDNVSWQLDVTNKKTFWTRRMTYVAPVTGTDGQASGDKTTTTLLHENGLPLVMRELVYAEDPNFDGFSHERNNGLSANLADEFNFFPPGSTPGALNGEFNKHEYVLENTMAAAEQYEDVTTSILVRATFQPANITAGEGYYFYAGSAFSHAAIVAMVANSATNPWPQTPVGLKEAVETAQAEGAPWNFTSATPPTSSAVSLDGKLKYYKDQICYYRILLRHFDDEYSVGDMNFGRYGVVRNNVYKVTLNSVTGPGEPFIPKPEGPDDKEKSYISAFVEVLPWVVRSQDVDL